MSNVATWHEAGPSSTPSESSSAKKKQLEATYLILHKTIPLWNCDIANWLLAADQREFYSSRCHKFKVFEFVMRSFAGYACLFLAAMYAYNRTLFPSVPVSLIGLGLLANSFFEGTDISRFLQGGDSGELLAEAFNFGIAHPPGYPTFILLYGAWMHSCRLLFNIAPAHAANLLGSALTAAAACLVASSSSKVALILKTAPQATLAKAPRGSEPSLATDAKVRSLLAGVSNYPFCCSLQNAAYCSLCHRSTLSGHVCFNATYMDICGWI